MRNKTDLMTCDDSVGYSKSIGETAFSFYATPDAVIILTKHITVHCLAMLILSLYISSSNHNLSVRGRVMMNNVKIQKAQHNRNTIQ